MGVLASRCASIVRGGGSGECWYGVGGRTVAVARLTKVGVFCCGRSSRDRSSCSGLACVTGVGDWLGGRSRRRVSQTAVTELGVSAVGVSASLCRSKSARVVSGGGCGEKR